MKPSDFDRLANELFSAVLAPHGFSNQYSKYCTFYRKTAGDIYHFVMQDMSTRGDWYDIRVFPHSPAIRPNFEKEFPDSLGIPTDRFSLLSDRGVGPYPMQFTCKSEELFRRRFNLTVADLLVRYALPYLDRFQTVTDLIPELRRPSFLGFALLHVGRKEEAFAVLRKERDRLLAVAKIETDQSIPTLIHSIDQALGE